MRIILNLLVLGFQGIITFVTLLVIYMIFVLLDYQGGIDSFIGTTLFQPIMGGLISLITILICLTIGLPIRLSNRVNTWWTKRIWLPIFGTIIGLSLLIVSLLPSMRGTTNTIINEEIIQRQIPNLGFATTGWFLTSFSLLHLFPPYRLRIWTEDLYKKLSLQK
jgi:hypothetical protein